MRFPFVSRRRHDAETNALRAQLDEMRDQRDRALKSASTWHGTASRTSELFTDTSIVNDCLTRDITAAREQIAELQAQLTDGAVAEWRAQAKREKRRADRLQKQYDDAVGLKPNGIEDSGRWQPGYQAPKAGAS